MSEMSVFIIDCAHYSEELIEDNMGFFTSVCACGWRCQLALARSPRHRSRRRDRSRSMGFDRSEVAPCPLIRLT
jgi:hypothetical protein